MIVEIQCLPTPAGTAANPYEHIEAAISVIQASGLAFEVGALGTTIQGEPEQVWAVARAAHEAVLASGARGLVTVLKIEQTRSTEDQPTIESLTGKFRS
jgi:uncharacterized protein YqgV (UPF0045/DUF77 family)